ncbi:tectonic [Teleopsis dalmanni]|uniref:tectonic n=1 Tax=Teleopsis dalmanni TaxID=139649 RepID=UPI0018CCFFB6|nr:tectonic [Teleopsis dalmanni]
MNCYTPFKILIISTLLFEVQMIKIGISQPINSTNYSNEILTTTTTVTTSASSTDTNTAITSSANTNSVTTSSTTINSITSSTTTIVPTEQTIAENNFSTTVPITQTLPTFPPKKSKDPPTTTTIATSLSTAPTLVSREKGKEMDANSETKHKIVTIRRNNYDCFCNLRIDVCDMNCCCDIECPVEALEVFSCLKEQQHFDTQNTPDNIYYKHGLPLCSVNNSWLCIFRANLLFNVKKIDQEFDIKERHKWPNVLERTIEQETRPVAASLKYGDEIQIINLLDYEIRNIYISEGLPYCDFHYPILHLRTLTTSCLLRSIEEMQANKYKIQHIAMENNLLSRPYSEKITNLDLISEDIKMLTLRRCVRASFNSVEEKCEHLLYKNVTSDENNIAIAYVFTILHNYTNILGGNIDLKEIEASSINVETRFEYWQTYTVQFLPVSDSATTKDTANIDDLLEQPIHIASGPLGYLIGKPVIISRYIPRDANQEAIKNDKLIEYYNFNSTNPHMQHTLRLFTTHKKHCSKNLVNPSFINFGINTMKECNLLFNKNSLFYMKTENFTLLCNEIQKAIYAKFFEEDTTNLLELSDILISQYGKPSKESNKWLPLQVQNADDIPIFGEFKEQTQSFVCHNMIVSAAYEFQYEVVNLYNIKNQALLKHAELIMGQRLDLEFALYEALIVPLTVSVMFFDVNEIDHFANSQGTSSFINSIAYNFYLHSLLCYIFLNYTFTSIH